MYLYECAEGYIAAVQLGQKETDYQTALALMTVKKQLQSHVDFLQEEEIKLAERYGEKDEEGRIKWTERGTFTFIDSNAGERYRQERKKLNMTKVEQKFKKLHAPEPERITPAQLEALQSFIIFGDGGEE